MMTRRTRTRRRQRPGAFSREEVAAVRAAMTRWRRAEAGVGRTEAEHLRWLMAFEGRDLTGAEALAAATAEVQAFLGHYVFEVVGSVRVWKEIGALGGLSHEEALDMQGHLRAFLRQLREKGHAWFPAPIVHGVTWDQKRGVFPATRGETPDRVFAALFHLFARIGPQLRVCGAQECGRFFLPNRPYQRFCSKTCGARVRVARFRQAHPVQVSEWRHRRYARRVQARAGARVKVERRPRRQKA